MRRYRTSRVFVPGGMPEHTYVPRTNRRLEERLSAAKDYLCKLVTVTGMTKSGKTVLTNKVFPREESIWIDGGAVGSEDDFWSYILDEISGYTDIGLEDTEESAHGIHGSIEAEGGVPLVARGRGQLGSSFGRTRGKRQSQSLTLSPRAAAVSQLQKVCIPLIIDDFHYLDRSFQGNIVRALKPLIFQGVPIILIAIPHRRYDAVKVEREMTGRLEPISVPTWELDELLQIAHEGFPLLNVDVGDTVCERLAGEAYGSPHLMQEFCRALASMHGIQETVQKSCRMNNIPDPLFSQVAEHTGKVIFDKLAKGPRQRRDRIQRQLKDGGTADIYEVILLALANLQPGLETVDYESLRSSIREIVVETVPRAHEVTRVLEKMAEIAASDEASTPVLDWEKEDQKLHITDPFFAFYLKWGVTISDK
jgi:hypothetical protein